MFLARVGNHPRCNINYDPSHFLLQQLDYLAFIDIYDGAHQGVPRQGRGVQPDRPAGRLFGLPGLDRSRRPLPLARRRPGRFRRDLLQARGDTATTAGPCWNGSAASRIPRTARAKARRSSPRHIIRVTEKAFDDFAGGRRPTRRRSGACWAIEVRHGWRSSRTARIRLGMIGGGEGAFIGAVHRIAARLDDQLRLRRRRAVVDAREGARRPAPRSDSIRSAAMPTSTRWSRAEAARPDGIEAVAIVTPNHVHYAGGASLPQGRLHVICDKPLTTTLDRGRRSCDAGRRESGRVFAVTYNYTGYPLVRHAREMVADGELGDDPAGAGRVRAGLADRAARGDRPEAGGVAHRSGAIGRRRRIGDIGTHAFQLAHFVTGLRAERPARRSVDLRSRPPRRRQCHSPAALRRTARAACCGPARSRPATRTV